MLVKASSIDALSSTNGVTCDGVTLMVPGSLVLARLESYVSVSMFLHNPLLVPLVGYLALCFCPFQVAPRNLSLSCLLS